jgi:phosphoribosylformimino-5-aminoimidazole carboxamide ribotide isomerase
VKLIPVIDILNGVAVHAVKGKRSEYQPLKSVLCSSADPLAVACKFRSCGFSELYVADLDAIMAKGENLAVLQKIADKTGLALMVDAGISDIDGAERLFRGVVAKVIVGTETLPSLSCLKEMLQQFGSEKVVVSLDLKNGKVLSKSPSIAALDVFELARNLEKIGVCELIVLDLARVGSEEGVDMALLEKLLRELKVKVDVGGGVRDIDDLAALKLLGVHGVLLATALHSGKISVDELYHAGQLN